ncbi:MAG TPA: glycosyl hydrolase, partial [Cellvibrionaceae bacterium]|nr:glycosyl hydrolase [Cellvibrionaceae bacterium]
MVRLSSIICLALCASLTGCKTGFNRPLSSESSTTSIPCNPTAADSNASSEAKAVLKIVATFSCEKDTDSTKRVLSGQVLGTVGDAQNFERYNRLFTEFNNNGTYYTPAVMGIDYALTNRFNQEEFTQANNVIEPHSDLGGLILVSWTPSNPWDSGFNTGYTSQVDLPALTQGFSSEAKDRWQEDIKQLTNALLNLQQRRVAVILRPLPLMNSDRYWWGINATGANKENDFKDLWSDLFKQLNDAGIENVIWAYSPLDTSEPNTKAFNWGFNKEFVDLVTPVVRNDNFAKARRVVDEVV